MRVDITEFLKATTREIRTSDVDGQPARVLVAGRSYATDRDDLWNALTDIERIPRWFLPITGDLRVGGRFQFEGNAGGEIQACDPPESFRVTWEFGGGTSWVTIRLDPVQGGTRLTLEHTACVPDEMWEQFGPGAVGVGWEMGFLGMEAHILSDESLSPTTAMTWLASDEGKAMIRTSSLAWRDASVAAGTPFDAATAAAERTTAAYTGENPEATA